MNIIYLERITLSKQPRKRGRLGVDIRCKNIINLPMNKDIYIFFPPTPPSNPQRNAHLFPTRLFTRSRTLLNWWYDGGRDQACKERAGVIELFVEVR